MAEERLIICNTSPIINLAEIGHIDHLPKVLAQKRDSWVWDDVPLRGWAVQVPACESRLLRCSSVVDVHPRPHHALHSAPTGSAFFRNYFWQKV